jgi:hypothetical protein
MPEQRPQAALNDAVSRQAVPPAAVKPEPVATVHDSGVPAPTPKPVEAAGGADANGDVRFSKTELERTLVPPAERVATRSWAGEAVSAMASVGSSKAEEATRLLSEEQQRSALLERKLLQVRSARTSTVAHGQGHLTL